jgi:hypothetical protein
MPHATYLRVFDTGLREWYVRDVRMDGLPGERAG